jgi:hypothetical protein
MLIHASGECRPYYILQSTIHKTTYLCTNATASHLACTIVYIVKSLRSTVVQVPMIHTLLPWTSWTTKYYFASNQMTMSKSTRWYLVFMNNVPLRAIRRAVWLHTKSSFKGNVCTLTGIHMERKGIYDSYGMFGLYAGCPSIVERYTRSTTYVLRHQETYKSFE